MSRVVSSMTMNLSFGDRLSIFVNTLQVQLVDTSKPLESGLSSSSADRMRVVNNADI